MSKSCYLSTFDLNVLDRACEPLVKAFGRCVYLVGSAMQRPDFRDVDVRAVVTDDEFDAVFGPRPALWAAVSFSMTAYLRSATGLPVDFQVQRMTEANALDGTVRNPLGFGRRVFAGGGDATRFDRPWTWTANEANEEVSA